MPVARITLQGDALHGVDSHLIPQHLMASLPQQVALGRIRPKAMPPALRLSAYFRADAMATPPPASTSWRTKAAPALAHMYLNDRYGCCVIAGKAHALGVWSANDPDHSGAAIVTATDQEIWSQYQGICGPGDNGCNISQVLDVMRTRGFQAGGQLYKIDGYVSVDWTNQLEVKVVQAIFGASTIGINLPEDWTKSAVWDVTNSQIVGGHDVTPIDYDDKGVYISSWGRIYQITWRAFTSRQWVEEYYALLAPLWYGSDKLAPSGIDASTLQADLQKLSAGQLPDVGPAPVPVPSPTPTPPPAPPSPTPGPAPTPTPTPGPNPIKGFIDNLIGQLETLIAADVSNPFLDRLLVAGLEQLQRALDAMFGGAAAPTAISPAQVRTLADAVLGLAAAIYSSNPQVLGVIKAIQAALDALLAHVSSAPGLCVS